MRKYRKHSSEFKRDLISQIESGIISKCAVGRKYEISTTLIDRWQKQIREGTFKDTPNKKEIELEKELDRYKIKVGELTLQIDLLKKSTAT